MRFVCYVTTIEIDNSLFHRSAKIYTFKIQITHVYFIKYILHILYILIQFAMGTAESLVEKYQYIYALKLYSFVGTVWNTPCHTQPMIWRQIADRLRSRFRTRGTGFESRCGRYSFLGTHTFIVTVKIWKTA